MVTNGSHTSHVWHCVCPCVRSGTNGSHASFVCVCDRVMMRRCFKLLEWRFMPPPKRRFWKPEHRFVVRTLEKYSRLSLNGIDFGCHSVVQWRFGCPRDVVWNCTSKTHDWSFVPTSKIFVWGLSGEHKITNGVCVYVRSGDDVALMRRCFLRIRLWFRRTHNDNCARLLVRRALRLSGWVSADEPCAPKPQNPKTPKPQKL